MWPAETWLWQRCGSACQHDCTMELWRRVDDAQWWRFYVHGKRKWRYTVRVACFYVWRGEELLMEALVSGQCAMISWLRWPC